jgi:formylglycine-generating enzyme required for sulfatase activity
MACGSTIEMILKEYKGLTKEDIQACLLFATKYIYREYCGKNLIIKMRPFFHSDFLFFMNKRIKTQEKMNDIFISYARQDEAAARNICQALEKLGWSVWWDQKIPAGATFREDIQNELNNSKCILVLWSEHAIKSDFVKDEADVGKEKKILIPVLIDNCEIPLGFRQVQTHRMDNVHSACKQSDLETLNSAISKILKQQVESTLPRFSIIPEQLSPMTAKFLIFFSVVLMSFFTAVILSVFFPQPNLEIVIPKMPIIIGGQLVNIIIFFLCLKTYFYFFKELRIVTIIIILLPLCSLFSVGASAYILDKSFTEVLVEICLPDETDDFEMPEFRPTPSIPPVNPEPSPQTPGSNKTEIEPTPETKQIEKTKSTELNKEHSDQTNNQLDDKQVIHHYADITHEIEDSFQNDFDMRFVRIPAGTFEMGSPENEKGRFSNETLHKVTLTQDFYMQTTEVTQGQWKAVMGQNPSHFKNCGDNCPVEQVSWNDVQAFIKRLNVISKGQQYRLPTEAEWEYAARAGSKTAFANGDIQALHCDYDPNLDKMGWYCGNSSKTQPVAQKQANQWHIYDMHGNVWEWCSDYFGKYPSEHLTNPKGPETGASRVVRGGSWIYHARSCRSAYRNWFAPDSRYRSLGFRLVAP